MTVDPLLIFLRRMFRYLSVINNIKADACATNRAGNVTMATLHGFIHQRKQRSKMSARPTVASR